MSNFVAIISFVALACYVSNGIEYLVVGENVGCNDYDGFTSITTAQECADASIALELGCSTSSEISSTIYPKYCYYNKAGSSCSYQLYFNPTTTGTVTTASSTRFPICKSTNTPSTTCTKSFGNVATGGSTTPNTTDNTLFTCSSNFMFTPDFSRTGFMYFNFNPKEQETPWGVQKWQLDTTSTGSQVYSTLYNYVSGDSFYDTTVGLAIDNSRQLLYTFVSHKYASTGTSYQRWLVQININTGNVIDLLHDYYPYNCHPLGTTIYRSLMDIDETNNILYWIGEDDSNALTLYSLDLMQSNYIVKVEVIISNAYNPQMSQLVVDCNGNVWFTEIFDGLYVYKPGWNSALIMLSESDLNGFQFIRRDSSTRMDLIIANNFVIRNYTNLDLNGGYISYPSPPHQDRIGSDGDIMHNLFYDYQNNKMCVWTKTNDGNYMLFCYDPFGDTNIVWNFLYGPFERSNVVIRFGNYNNTQTTTTSVPTTTLIMDTTKVTQNWDNDTQTTTTSVPTTTLIMDTTDGTQNWDNDIEYFMVEQYKSCTDSNGGQEIIIADECLHAANELNLIDGCDYINEDGSSRYPRYCYHNTAGTGCNYKLYFNPDITAPKTGTTTRRPLCKRPVGSSNQVEYVFNGHLFLCFVFLIVYRVV